MIDLTATCCRIIDSLIGNLCEARILSYWLIFDAPYYYSYGCSVFVSLVTDNSGHPGVEGITNGVIFSSPVIDESGVVYVGSNDNNLTAFNSDGSIKWTFTTGNWVDSSLP